MKIKLFLLVLVFGNRYLFSQNEEKLSMQSLQHNIEGKYYNEECQLTLVIHKIKDDYYYKYKSKERDLKGEVSLDRSEDGLYITLEGIEYSQDYFDVALPDEDVRNEIYEKLQKKGKRTVGINVYVEPDGSGLVIQNSGNSMNYYVKLYDCDQKYIHFKRL